MNMNVEDDFQNVFSTILPISTEVRSIVEERRNRSLLEAETRMRRERYESQTEGELEKIQNTLTAYLRDVKGVKTIKCPHCRDIEIPEAHQKVCLPCVLTQSNENAGM